MTPSTESQTEELMQIVRTGVPTQTEWLDKHQAAAALDMSTRSVLAMAGEGRIRSKRERDARTKQLTVFLHAGDVERTRYERQQPRALQPVKMQTPHTKSNALLQTAGPVPLAQKLFLTEAEAVAYSGLGSAYLRQFVPGENKGPHGARVYRRRDLEAL